MTNPLLPALLISGFASAACAESFQMPPLSEMREAAASLPAPNAAPPDAKPRKWTLMFYFNGKNDVESYALKDMNKLEEAGSSAEVAVTSELGRSGWPGVDSPDEKWAGARRYLVHRDSDTARIGSPPLEAFPQTDMGDWRHLAGFVRWAKSNFPAEHYMLLVWDHGWGWLDPKNPTLGYRSISHDFDNGSYVKTAELKQMLESAGGVDVFATMACFMQMAEIDWELKKHARVIVGSEEVIQLPSFDFAAIVRRLEAEPDAGPERLGEIFVDSFKELYSRPDMLDMLEKTKYGVQLSAVRADRVAGLKPLLDKWAELTPSGGNKALSAAREGVLRMELGDEKSDPDKSISSYADLGNFMEIYAAALPPQAAELRELSLGISGYVSNELVIKNTGFCKDRTGKDYSRARGLAINIPGRPGTLLEAANKYSDLDFARQTGWGGFVSGLAPAPAR
ncbi:MAG: clostripain-related cysteine peptidase [Elusimicrobiales bacterium]